METRRDKIRKWNVLGYDNYGRSYLLAEADKEMVEEFREKHNLLIYLTIPLQGKADHRAWRRKNLDYVQWNTRAFIFSSGILTYGNDTMPPPEDIVHFRDR